MAYHENIILYLQTSSHQINSHEQLRNVAQANVIIEWAVAQFCAAAITKTPGLFLKINNPKAIAITLFQS